jgi:hypothetical protein
VLLVGLWRKKGSEKPFATIDLTYVTKLCKGCNALLHDWNLAWAMMDFLYGNGFCGSCVDDTRIVLDRDKLTLIIKYTPILLEKAVNLIAQGCLQMRQVQLLPQLRAMD